MTARTHNAFAIATLVTAAAIFPPENLNLLTLAGSLIAVNIGALFPDMDQAGNDLWKLFPAQHNFGRVLRRVFYKHRTLTHSIVGLYLVYQLLLWLLPKVLNPAYVDPEMIMYSFLAGFISHLIADSFTEEGLPLLFPINLNFGIPPIRSWRIKTGKWFENILVLPAAWLYVVWMIHQNRVIFVNILRKITS